MGKTRKATHAGSWYTGNGSVLRKELDGWLAAVPDEIDNVGGLPQAGARMIIAPHAGYRYSGATAAWAYKALNLKGVKRVFLLGPSHHVYLSNCALSKFDDYGTPMGNIRLDKETIAGLSQSGMFRSMSPITDEEEHSLELHLPFIHKRFEECFDSPSAFPTLVPILVGSTNRESEKRFGELLAPYLLDSQNAFVVSSDFAHWGMRFSYTRYLQDLGDLNSLISLGSDSPDRPKDPAIHESIKRIDDHIIDRIEAGNHRDYWDALEATGNTVCGRHPIGIVLAAIETLVNQNRVTTLDAHFQFVQYSRSTEVEHIRDSSVSYASAYAVVKPSDILSEVMAEQGRFRGFDAEFLIEQLTGRKPPPDTPLWAYPKPWKDTFSPSYTSK